MKNLSNTLTGILNRHALTLSELADMADLPRPSLSKLRAGNPPSAETLRRILEHATQNREERAELLKAYLLDHIDHLRVDRSLVSIATPNDTSDDLRGQLNAEVYGWLTTLGRAIAGGHEEFEGIVEELAHLAHRFQARTNTVDFLAAEDANEYSGTPAERHPFPDEGPGA